MPHCDAVENTRANNTAAFGEMQKAFITIGACAGIENNIRVNRGPAPSALGQLGVGSSGGSGGGSGGSGGSASGTATVYCTGESGYIRARASSFDGVSYDDSRGDNSALRIGDSPGPDPDTLGFIITCDLGSYSPTSATLRLRRGRSWGSNPLTSWGSDMQVDMVRWIVRLSFDV